MHASIGSQEPQSPTSSRDDDFLAQHLSNLLVRQPSSARADRQASLPLNRTAVSPSDALHRHGSIGETSRSTRNRTSESLANAPSNDVFDSFFKQNGSEHGGESVRQDNDLMQARRSLTVSEPAHIAGDGRRRGPSTVSMSTSFGGRRARTSRSGTDVPSSDESSITSQSSHSSDLNYAAPSDSPTTRTEWTRKYPPGKLGDAKSVQYLTNETEVTTPSAASGFSSADNAGKTAITEWNPAFVHHALHNRRPSMTLSYTASSFSSSGSPPSRSEGASGVASPMSTEFVKERQQKMFEDGSSIEPPDATEEVPNLSDRIRDQHFASMTMSSITADTAKHSSMTTRRISPKRSSMTVTGSCINDSSSSDSARSLNNTNSTQRGQPSEVGDKAAGRIRNGSIVEIDGNVVRSSSSTTCDSSQADRSCATSAQTAAMHARKQSVSLIPAGDDGRTFKFVTSSS